MLPFMPVEPVGTAVAEAGLVHSVAVVRAMAAVPVRGGAVGGRIMWRCIIRGRAV